MGLEQGSQRTVYRNPRWSNAFFKVRLDLVRATETTHTQTRLLLKITLRLWESFTKSSQLLRKTSFTFQEKATPGFTCLTYQRQSWTSTSCQAARWRSTSRAFWLTTHVQTHENATFPESPDLTQSSNTSTFTTTASWPKRNTMTWLVPAQWDTIVLIAQELERVLTKSLNLLTLPFSTFMTDATTKTLVWVLVSAMVWILSISWPKVEENLSLTADCHARTKWECTTGSMNLSSRASSTSTFLSIGPTAMNKFPPGTKRTQNKATHFTRNSSSKSLESGSSPEIMTPMSQSLELWHGSSNWDRKPTWPLNIHGTNGGSRVSISMKIKSEVWLGDWEDWDLSQLEVLVTWPTEINVKPLGLWLMLS